METLQKPALVPQSELQPPEAVNQSAESALTIEEKLEIIRQGNYFAADVLGQTEMEVRDEYKSREAVDASIASIEESMEKYGGKIEDYLDIRARHALEQLGSVNLSRDYVYLDSTEDEAARSLSNARRSVGLLDEDSFDFTWQLMEHFAEIDEAAPAIEKRAEIIVTQLKRFIDNEDGLTRARSDPRMKGVLHLHAAYELAQVGDVSAAQAEIDQIEEPRLRARLHKMLEDAQKPLPKVTPEESQGNFDQAVKYLPVAEVPPSDAEIETRIVTNRSLDTFARLFDPLSDGRIIPPVYGVRANDEGGRPSSGDSGTRRWTEQMLGHGQHLFAPRVVYGIVKETDDIMRGDDGAWAYGQARFVLREGSSAADSASFSVGDSLNGTPFTSDRILDRQDANRYSKVLKSVHERGGHNKGFGSTTQYAEAQVEGVHIKDIEAVVLRPNPMAAEDAEKLLETAITAAQHGIYEAWVMNFDKIQQANGDSFTAAEVAETLIARVRMIQEKAPGVVPVIEVTREQADLLSGKVPKKNLQIIDTQAQL